MVSSSPLVGIVVLNFNGRKSLYRCLGSLQRLQGVRFFVVVVDNASQDDSLVLARKQFPEYTYILNRKNKGFASGMNTGSRVALEKGADFVWLFNNDAWAEENSLKQLVAVAEKNKDVGLLSPYIFEEKTERLWFGKGRVDALRMRVLHSLPTEQEQTQEWHRSMFLTGCALLVRKAVFQEVGFLDERFFLYYEDADFSFRARKRGFQTVAVPRARVIHAEQSQKNPQKLYHLVLSGLLFFEKHATFWQKPYFLVYGTIRRIKNIFDRVRGKDEAPLVHQAYKYFYHER